MSQVAIDCKSENYQGKEAQVVFLNFNVSLNTAQEQTLEKGSDDLLKIKFSHAKPVPEEVKDYINNNLGVFSLSENGNEKILTFELKINDINLELIRFVFEKYFAPEASNANFSLTYSRTQNPMSWIPELKNHSDLPFILQLIEHSHIRLEGQDSVALLEALFKYVKSENPGLLQPWMNLLLTLTSLKLTGTFRSFEKMQKGSFEKLEFEQIDNIKEFFFLFDNPINNYIFEKGQPGNLEISGRILNILNYEFKSNFPNMQEFIEKVLNL